MSRTASPRTRQRRRLSAVAGLVAAALLSGCGQESPGSAVSIDGETISLDRVDAYAGAVCDYSRTSAELAGQPAEPVSGAELRSFVLDLLVQSELTDRVAEQVGVSVPPSAGAQEPDAQTRAVIDAMPADEGARVADIYAVNQRTTALRRAIGTQLLADEGTQGTGDEADQRAREAVAAVEQDADIEVDPRLEEAYAAQVEASGGTASSAGSPLSVAVSTEAGAEGAQSAALSCS